MIKVLELFGGIGACTKALKRLGVDIEVVDYVEIDKYCVKSYNAINNTSFDPQDITKWNKDVDVDLVMHGSPCQDFSVMGLNKGGDYQSGTRSSLMYESIRIVEKTKPKYVIWENVKNLLSKKHIHNFNSYLNKMEKLGYVSYYKVLNSKDYGIPQNRQRVFTVSIRKDINTVFEFPKHKELNIKLKDMLEKEVDKKYFLSKKMIKYICVDNDKWTINNGKSQSLTQKVVGSSISGKPLLIKNNTKKGYLEAYPGDGIYTSISNKRGTVQPQTIQTLTTQNDKGVVLDDLKIRKITPKESWRLMGFDDEDFEKAKLVNSDTQLFKQAGNSVVVNILEEIFKNLFVENKCNVKRQLTIFDFMED